MVTTIFQNPVFTDFILPFVLIFVIVFALLEKTKILGDGKKQIDAIVAFVVALIFVGVAFPKEVVNNMVLFLAVALVVAFVALLILGFVSGKDFKEDILSNKAVKWIVMIGVVVIVVVALIWATGFDGSALDFLFRNKLSETFWINFTFIAVIAIAIAIVLRKGK